MIDLSEFDLNENNNKNDTKDFDELEQNHYFNDIKTMTSIEINNIKITNENNLIQNINLTSSNNIINIDKASLEKTKLKNEESDKEQKHLNENIINKISSKIKVKKKNIILIIIIILLTFLKNEKMFINIINLICLVLAIYLLLKGR